MTLNVILAAIGLKASPELWLAVFTVLGVSFLFSFLQLASQLLGTSSADGLVEADETDEPAKGKRKSKFYELQEVNGARGVRRPAAARKV